MLVAQSLPPNHVGQASLQPSRLPAWRISSLVNRPGKVGGFTLDQVHRFSWLKAETARRLATTAGPVIWLIARF